MPELLGPVKEYEQSFISDSQTNLRRSVRRHGLQSLDAGGYGIHMANTHAQFA